MPSQRFYRLSEEKRALIWKASMKEFISAPYEKVSINKITRDAGISRGSFRKKWGACCQQRLEDTDGDLCSAMGALMEYGMEFCRNNNLFRLHRNLVMYPGAVLTEGIEKDFDFERVIGEDFFGKIDRSRLKDGTDQGVVLLIKLCVACMMAAFTEYYKYPEKEEIIKAEYQKALRILCYGAYKTPQKDRLEEKVNE